MDTRRIVTETNYRDNYTMITWAIGLAVSGLYLLYGLYFELDGVKEELDIFLMNIASLIVIAINIVFSIIVNFDLNAKIDKFTLEVRELREALFNRG